jgi:hypothetical protein
MQAVWLSRSRVDLPGTEFSGPPWKYPGCHGGLRRDGGVCLIAAALRLRLAANRDGTKPNVCRAVSGLKVCLRSVDRYEPNLPGRTIASTGRPTRYDKFGAPIVESPKASHGDVRQTEVEQRKEVIAAESAAKRSRFVPSAYFQLVSTDRRRVGSADSKEAAVKRLRKLGTGRRDRSDRYRAFSWSVLAYQ